jgi:hypothetical protein
MRSPMKSSMARSARMRRKPLPCKIFISVERITERCRKSTQALPAPSSRDLLPFHFKSKCNEVAFPIRVGLIELSLPAISLDATTAIRWSNRSCARQSSVRQELSWTNRLLFHRAVRSLN